MIRILGRKTSSNVQMVMWTLAELGLNVTREDYGHVFGGTKTPEYLEMNPMGLVPTMIDGTVTMFESAAIVRYLAARYGDGGFYPADPALRGPLDSWAEWVKTAFGPAVLVGLFYPLVRVDPALVAPDAVDKGAAAIAPLAAMLDKRIGAGPWLAGEQFTYADIVVGHLLYRYYVLPFERADLPNLAAYYERLKARPAFAENVMISYEPLRFGA